MLSCSRGASAVEFALVVPFLCLILFGIMVVGVFLGLAHSLEQIAADAGRYAVVGLAAEERHRLAEQWVLARADQYPLLAQTRLSASTEEVGNAFTVRVRYDASALPRVPFLDAFFETPKEITRSSTYAVP
ncbi:hypothetical protein GCM10011390_40950 [Aureimonas endophytica]|uniref:TadE-like domain-containing protein n=1 Tax=Aureimonas endophytica TaxID=2027858 RepID=A0A916ZXN1_9HYPH|nr:TadE/TadG family type IV pilus assembly protein [Aureimonas endophytica]GGE17622.1 hypothetical protein GCM10011390_40950 [Aureimonas endophytica]